MIMLKILSEHCVDEQKTMELTYTLLQADCTKYLYVSSFVSSCTAFSGFGK